MKNYIIKPRSVRRNEVLEREYSFSGFSYRFVECQNKSISLLGSNEILDKNIKGFEPGSKEYIDFSDNYFVRISEMDNLNFTFTTSKDTKKIRPVENTNKSKTIYQGDICYQTASNVGNVCIYDGEKAFYNSHIRKLSFKKNKYYVFAILKSAFGKEQVDVSGSIKGVDNFREEYLLNTKIPFPTTKNHPNPEQVENLVALIVQNIIDKEEQIKLKNKQIDELIEKEIKENQKVGSFSYSYPRISEIKEKTRLDTGLYEKEFKEIDFLIRNYEGGYFQLLSKYTANRGQNLQISNIGESIYSDNKKPNFYRLFTNVELTDNRTISGYRWIGNKNKLNLIPKKTIFLSADGTVGRCIYVSDAGNTITNIHPWIINKIKQNDIEYDDIFVAMFLGYLYGKSFYEKIKDKANGGGIKLNHLQRYLLIPNFPEYKQQEIAKLYYNPLEKNKDLNLENYLKKEQTKNREVGIFQLNMEIFTLREQLEDLVHKIVIEEKIELKI